MKISESTLSILKNFSTINTGVLIKQGNELRTMAPLSNIFAVAKLEDTFPRRFAIYDIQRFLGTLSLCKEPEIEFAEKSLSIIPEEGDTLNYVYADESVVMKAPEIDPKTAAVIASFQLAPQTLDKLVKAAAVWSCDDLTITAKDGVLMLKVHDGKNTSSDTRRIRVGTTNAESNFTIDLKVANLKVMPTTYAVEIHRTLKGKYVVKFDNGKVVYYITSEASSVVTKE